MGFTGDSLVITFDKRFVRIDSLQKGDKLLSPDGDEVIVKNIISEYKEKGYILKSKNFFPIYIDNISNLLTTKILKIYDEKIQKNKYVLKNFTFNNIKDIKTDNFIVSKTLINNENKELNNIWLYGKILLKGKINNKTNQIILSNPKNNIQNYKDNIINLKNINYGKNKTYNKLFLNIEDNNYIDLLNKNLHQRYLKEEIFDLKSSDIEIFLNSFIKENTEMFINNNQCKLYIPSKILIVQLFYLMSQFYNKAPNVELIKKEEYDLKEIKQSNKKRMYSLTYHPDIKNSVNKNNYILQEIDYILETNRRLKYFEIETENNKSFYVYNLIVNSFRNK